MAAIRALTVVLTAWVLVLLAPAGPATAGGPTSVLLSVPGEGRTASLYYTDASYDELAHLVGVDGGSGTTDDAGRSHEAGTGVNVTWLIHDVMPWRVDRIYLQGEGAPWIATQVVEGDTDSVWDSPVVWHQPEDGKALTRLLNSLGVGQPGAAAGSLTSAEPGGIVPPSVEPAAAGTTPADDTSDTPAGHGVRWGLGGLAVGVLLAAGWMRLRSVRRPAPDGGRDPDAERPDAGPNAEWLSVGR
ncbi:MAG TPA: hypothetical protein VFV89_04980 [Nocardioides sp.]|uniref:hypothetical protein n=1 Tax=Nocardioides sp. TaxID=35761 RepID=UPI002E354009|nr:hypothetical protein [Nocardioides sp.]HEX5087141.1 hypothetical protein [Nocardioides sp.]